ncbi:nicotinate-nicotinamide nucleotide adenylyltransferase [Vibrio sp. LaRot3]|uniref:nicotinate-nicotinamide nucleotide adenylyltransferase n=1 Tax=Vibrio sp. LaRot3 TaxID=2998829 RepID=UPI0022CE153D|nr:nicotinate-nicotinamide nucleotide adenylyltransferase [Vibrio sp. LaRot3]MDA0150236.1 nicotinate-nicotinamide nucleotide adenylyltransferase [Vibrio sp. LaRot3]
MSKIAVFGSAFNPPSLGHKSVIESLQHFDRVLLLPSISHAWGKQMLDYSQRTKLVDAFIDDLALHNVSRSQVEEDLFEQTGQAVTTFAVLEALQQQSPDAELTFVMGPDNLFNFSKFYKSDEIVRRWSVMACPETVAIRSTDIRHALQKNLPINHLTTPKVCSLLADNKYY